MDKTIQVKPPENEYLVAFDVAKKGVTITAVRIRIDEVVLSDLDERFNINLSQHPLYAQLERYVLANKAKK